MKRPDPVSFPPGTIIQILPANNPRFGGCLAVIDKAQAWGVTAYVLVPGQRHAEPIYVRLTWPQVTATGGTIAFALGQDVETEGEKEDA